MGSSVGEEVEGGYLTRYLQGAWQYASWFQQLSSLHNSDTEALIKTLNLDNNSPNGTAHPRWREMTYTAVPDVNSPSLISVIWVGKQCLTPASAAGVKHGARVDDPLCRVLFGVYMMSHIFLCMQFWDQANTNKTADAVVVFMISLLLSGRITHD